MNTQIEEKFDLKKFLEPLENQLKTKELKFEDFKKCYDELKGVQRELQNLLEYGSALKKDEKEFGNLYKKLAGQNASDLIDSLTSLGYALKKDLGDAFTNLGYRLLEQTRAGKRDDVYYGILRIFVSYNKKFPNQLNEVFKPIYSDEMFKVFIFSFLSGIIGKDNQTENKN